MIYFTERNAMRGSLKKTYEITIPMYSRLLKCCHEYFDNLAWKYPLECPDGYDCCGIDMEALTNDLSFEIPALYMQNGTILCPQEYSDKINQYALLDFIEFIANNIQDISTTEFHSYFRHDHLYFGDTNNIAQRFAREINELFTKIGLLYKLNNHYEIERIADNEVLTEKIELQCEDVNEKGLRELLQEAIALHKSPLPNDNKNAVEKIWDAFERLKTYFTYMNKKDSATKIIDLISAESKELKELFTAEFKTLTDMGNQYRIRHHETDKIDISDIRQYDYFFNRCLSVIAIGIQYLN